jgi:hypothetical protein
MPVPWERLTINNVPSSQFLTQDTRALVRGVKGLLIDGAFTTISASRMRGMQGLKRQYPSFQPLVQGHAIFGAGQKTRKQLHSVPGEKEEKKTGKKQI